MRFVVHVVEVNGGGYVHVAVAVKVHVNVNVNVDVDVNVELGVHGRGCRLRFALRSVTFRYPDLETLEKDLQREDPELPLPSSQRGDDGEWVLAVFKVDDGRTATAAAARLEDRGDGLALVFEPRDWQRLAAEVLTPVTPNESPLDLRIPPAPLTPQLEERPPRSKRGETRPPVSKRGGKKKSIAPPRTPRTTGRARTARSIPPPSSGGATVLTRTLVPPPSAEIHEADAPDHTLEAPVPIGASKRAPLLLLIDDDADMQLMIAEMLEAIGMQVECVGSAEEALDRLFLTPFDLVVLDWNLPGMSGLELCREVRRNARISGVPILFLTAKAESRDLVDAFAAGADDFVAKPFRAPELGARLLALLRRSKFALSSAPPSR